MLSLCCMFNCSLKVSSCTSIKQAVKKTDECENATPIPSVLNWSVLLCTCSQLTVTHDSGWQTNNNSSGWYVLDEIHFWRCGFEHLSQLLLSKTSQDNPSSYFPHYPSSLTGWYKQPRWGLISCQQGGIARPWMRCSPSAVFTLSDFFSYILWQPLMH